MFSMAISMGTAVMRRQYFRVDASRKPLKVRVKNLNMNGKLRKIMAP